MGFLNGHVSLKHLEGDQWAVRDDFRYFWERMGRFILVPEGQKTDHATRLSLIPDILVDNTGPVSNGAVPHDMFYRIFSEGEKYKYSFEYIYRLARGQYFTKKETDQMFFDINAKTKMPWHERIAVRIVHFNLRARRDWMNKEEWDYKVSLLDKSFIEDIKGAH